MVREPLAADSAITLAAMDRGNFNWQKEMAYGHQNPMKAAGATPRPNARCLRNWRSNNQTYGFRYTGGDDGAGGLVQTVGQGRDTAPIQLIADQRYKISDHTFTDDTQHQLSWSGNGDRAGSIIATPTPRSKLPNTASW